MAALKSAEHPNNSRMQPFIQGFLQISRWNDRTMASKLAPIEVVAANREVMQFTSELRLPVTENVAWRFRFGPSDEISAECTLTGCRYFNGRYQYEARWTGADAPDLGRHVRDEVLGGHLNYMLFQALQSYAGQEHWEEGCVINLLG